MQYISYYKCLYCYWYFWWKKWSFITQHL